MAEKQELKHLVRITDKDIKGDKSILYGLTNITGVGVSMSNAVCRLLKLDPARKIGSLSEGEVAKISETINDPIKAGVPKWAVNRQRDPETGLDEHMLGTKLKLRINEDLKKLKKIKCYRGIRHMFGLPLRGQRTKSNFRPNKGKGSLGVKTKGKTRGRV